METLFKKVDRALSDTLITPKTHPVLVSLLQMGGQPPGRAADIPQKMHVRLCREWRKIERVLVILGRSGVTDADVLAAMPFEGLKYGPVYGWILGTPHKLQYRDYVHRALLRVLSLKEAKLTPFEIRTVEQLRDAQKANGLPLIEEGVGKVRRMTRLHPGRRLLMSTELYGLTIFSVLQADACGRLTALEHFTRPRFARDWMKANGPEDENPS